MHSRWIYRANKHNSAIEENKKSRRRRTGRSISRFCCNLYLAHRVHSKFCETKMSRKCSLISTSQSMFRRWHRANALLPPIFKCRLHWRVPPNAHSRNPILRYCQTSQRLCLRCARRPACEHRHWRRRLPRRRRRRFRHFHRLCAKTCRPSRHLHTSNGGAPVSTDNQQQQQQQ